MRKREGSDEVNERGKEIERREWRRGRGRENENVCVKDIREILQIQVFEF